MTSPNIEQRKPVILEATAQDFIDELNSRNAIVPRGHDQPHNAFRIRCLGLGTSLYPESYKSSRVAMEMKQLLSSSEAWACCAKIRRTEHSVAAAERACDLIQGLGQNAGTKLSQAIA